MIRPYGEFSRALVVGPKHADAARAHRLAGHVLTKPEAWNLGAWYVTDVRGGYALVCEAVDERAFDAIESMMLEALKLVP